MDYTFIIWIVLAGALFGFLWRRGYLMRLAQFVGQTRDELRKCAWPSVDELKGSTVVVLVAAAIIGVYTVGVDVIANQLMQWIL